MKYIITESQYKLLTEDRILKLDFDVFNKDWNLLQRFLDKKGNPPYKIIGNLDLQNRRIKSLGNLVSVEGNLDLSYTKIESLGNLVSVGGYLSLYDTEITSLENLQYVGNYLSLLHSPLSKTTTIEEIRNIPNLTIEGGIYLSL